MDISASGFWQTVRQTAIFGPSSDQTWLGSPQIATHCEYGAKFDPKHALSCKKGAFIYLRHNQIQNFTDTLLGEALNSNYNNK